MKTRKTAREVVMKCVPCHRYSSNSPMSEPVSLPADRVKDANALDITGIDLAGPLFTRDGDWDKIMQETDIKPIKWKFNPPTAAWWGGWWERLVRVIKELLKRTLDKRFRKEYLGQLRQKHSGKPDHDFKVGDVVMIEEPSKKRVYWPLGKVISLLPGRDGKVRTLKLKCKNYELIRKIQRVYPLEVPFINNEIVKIDGVPTSSVNEDKLTSNAVIKNKVTRSGRLVKIPERLR
ncbi:uncharacterized protein TNCV_1639571 [Trichonephila clavipes]|nr:uncharacterized protein TNCV_1639571 [Trichonephila clavipes]